MRRSIWPLLLWTLAISCSEAVAPVHSVEVRTIVPLSPLEQSAAMQVALPADMRPRVRVIDADGNAVPRERIAFVVMRGGPTVQYSSDVTNSAGEAWMEAWYTGTRAGLTVVTAILTGNTSDTRAEFRLMVAPGPPTSVGMSKDSVRVAVGDSFPIGLVRRDDFGNVVDTLAGTTITSDDPGVVSVTANGSVRGVAPGRTAVVLENGAIRLGLLAVAGGVAARQATTIPSNTGEGYALATAPSGLAYAAGLGDGQLYRIAAGAQVATPIPWTGSNPDIVDGVFAPDETHAYFIAENHNQIFVLSVATDSVVAMVDVPHVTQRIGISNDGLYLIVTGPSQFTRVSTTSVEQSTFPLPWDSFHGTHGIVVHPSATTVYVSNTLGFVAAHDFMTGALLQQAQPGGTPQGLALDVSRNRLLVARAAGSLHVLDAGTLSLLFASEAASRLFDVRYDSATDAVWGNRNARFVTGAVERYSHSLTRVVERIEFYDSRRLGIRPDGSVLISAMGGVRLIPAP